MPDGDPAPIVVENDGLRIAALDWGGEGEPLVILHPTGFCAGFFDPLARRLRDKFRPIGVDLRGHGGTDSPDPAHPFTYPKMALDVLALLDHLGVSSWSSLGESGGGGVSVLVDRERPGAVRKMVLCEAIAFDLERVVQTPAGPRGGGNFMADIARKRRPVWPDRETVRASYAARPPLDALAPEFLDAYVRWGFVDRPDGQVELACPPEDEARMFEISADEDGAKAAFAHLTSLSCDAVVLAGLSSNLPTAWFNAQAERAGAPFVGIDGGHFFLHEDLDRAEALVREHLAA
ncbi:MAG: alpha/beta hydrolase [Actinobacteria bacterium]|nr:alpha/beta hydrolase [Actinomycetota bacterium]